MLLKQSLQVESPQRKEMSYLDSCHVIDKEHGWTFREGNKETVIVAKEVNGKEVHFRSVTKRRAEGSSSVHSSVDQVVNKTREVSRDKVLT